LCTRGALFPSKDIAGSAAHDRLVYLVVRSWPHSGALGQICDRIEFCRQVAPDKLNSANDDDSDQRSEQAVLDGRRAGFIKQKSSKIFHTVS
jgi:hypothetical protein